MSLVSHILVVTGASGAGKTATVEALSKRHIPGVQCFHFDSIGVPPLEVMNRDYGGADRWQADTTARWIEQLGGLSANVRVAVLDGQTRPQFVYDAAARAPTRRTHVVLFDCNHHIRASRLSGPRQQPELDDDRMGSWAAYLRGQADALGLKVVDTSALTLGAATDQLEGIIRELR
jgi:adenylate kinase family enzyme